MYKKINQQFVKLLSIKLRYTVMHTHTQINIRIPTPNRKKSLLCLVFHVFREAGNTFLSFGSFPREGMIDYVAVYVIANSLLSSHGCAA